MYPDYPGPGPGDSCLMIRTGARGVWYVESAARIIWDILCVNERQGGGEALEEVHGGVVE